MKKQAAAAAPHGMQKQQERMDTQALAAKPRFQAAALQY
jgi:hypothetical protein